MLGNQLFCELSHRSNVLTAQCSVGAISHHSNRLLAQLLIFLKCIVGPFVYLNGAPIFAFIGGLIKKTDNEPFLVPKLVFLLSHRCANSEYFKVI